MDQRIEDLTDKEKEALRLLLAGHDAKSSARELGLSVHTVNDRLRAARRKLGVSSSREAARILGQAEATTPEMSACNGLGIEAEEVRRKNGHTGNSRRKGLSLAWLTGGMLIMSLVIAIAMLVQGHSTGNIGQEAASLADEGIEIAVSEPGAAAERSARRWIALLDEGNWAGSWHASGEHARSAVSLDDWVAAVSAAREPFGAVASRETLTINRHPAPPDAPDGNYETVEFETTFESGDTAVETVVQMQVGDDWKVVGYFIR